MFSFPPDKDGITPSERYLSQLCRKSFLTLWSYPNPYYDSRKNEKGDGKELCDLLVVFGEHVIIFSDKYIKFNKKIDIRKAWKRWFRKAVFESAKQIYGAEKTIKCFPNRICLDKKCEQPFPIELPPADQIIVHRVIVAHGSYGSCQEFWGGGSIGSLMIKSDLYGEEHFDHPFMIGNVNPDKGFIHVLGEYSLNAALGEIDTIADFTNYFSKKERLLTNRHFPILAAGEEELVARYLIRMDDDGTHGFDIPNDYIGVAFDEGLWKNLINDSVYQAKKEKDRISYLWDYLIEHLIKNLKGFDILRGENIPFSEQEQGLRLMASEPRIRRRQIAQDLHDNLMKKTPPGYRRSRISYSPDFPKNAYIFLFLPQASDQDYAKYQENRLLLLYAHCKVAKLLTPKAEYIIGISTEPYGSDTSSEDLCVLNVKEWDDDRQKEAEFLRDELQILINENIQITKTMTKEFPDSPKPNKRPTFFNGSNRKQRRAFAAKRRKSRKRK